jgi:hypothetical protein
MGAKDKKDEKFLRGSQVLQRRDEAQKGFMENLVFMRRPPPIRHLPN